MKDSIFSRLDTSLMRSTKPQTDQEIPYPQTPQPQKDASTLTREDASTRTRVNANTREQKHYRPIANQKGYSLYKDQEEFLRTYSLQQKINGNHVTASQLIREAIDAYIKSLKEK